MSGCKAQYIHWRGNRRANINTKTPERPKSILVSVQPYHDSSLNAWDGCQTREALQGLQNKVQGL